MKPTRSKNKSAAVIRKIVREAVTDTLADIKTSGTKLKSWEQLWADARADREKEKNEINSFTLTSR